eukprot:15343203-Ditylum_brightwellii.AAC.1
MLSDSPKQLQKPIPSAPPLRVQTKEQAKVKKEVPTYMTIIQTKLNDQKKWDKMPKKRIHVIPDDEPRARRKSPRLHPLPPPHPHPITIPTPKESTSIPHYIPSDLPQLVNHIKEICNKYPWKSPLEEQANAVVDPTTGKSLEFRHLIKSQDKAIWSTSMANEMGRLAQGVGNRIKGTDTIFFIKHDQVPQGKIPTYARIVCDIWLQKEETHQTRIIVGGNLVNYQGNVSAPTAELSTAKLLFNSVISAPNA